MTYNFQIKEPYKRLLIAKMMRHFSDYMKAIKWLGDKFWLLDPKTLDYHTDKTATIKHKQAILTNGKKACHYFFNDNGGDDLCFERTCLEVGLEPEEARKLVTTLDSNSVASMYKKIQNQRRW